MGSNRGRAWSEDRSGPFRGHGRRSVRLRALVTHVQAGWQRYASMENVGLGGARLLVEEPLAMSDAVTLSFTAPTLWDPLVLRARVAWVGRGDLSSHVGLAFEHRSPQAVFALYELIVTLGYE
jgi:PilZ domain